MVSKQFIGGRIALFYQFWQEITSDPWVLETVLGYRIEFVDFPCQEYLPPLYMTAKELELIDQEIFTIQQKQAIHKFFHPGGPDWFLSPLFMVPKRVGATDQW